MIVVYDYENVGIDLAYAVESFIDKAVIERAVADHCDDIEILALDVPRLGNAKRRRNGSACMPRVVAVVFALFTLRKA